MTSEYPSWIVFIPNIVLFYGCTKTILNTDNCGNLFNSKFYTYKI